jgi:hypothetical protein
MDRRYQRAYLLEHPVTSMTVAAIILTIVGIGLIFTAVGAIIGLPMLLVAFLLGAGAWLPRESMLPTRSCH